MESLCLIGYKYNKNSVIFHGIYKKKEDSVNYSAILYQESSGLPNLLTLLSPRANTLCIIGEWVKGVLSPPFFSCHQGYFKNEWNK